MNEYRVKVTVRNNLLLSAIEEAGFKSQVEFAKSCGIHANDLSSIISMRSRPINYATGEFTKIAKKIMEALGASPSDLWTDTQLELKLDRNSSERVVSEDAIQYILENHINAMTLPCPESVLIEEDCKKLLYGCIDFLTEREKEVLVLHYGINGKEHTFNEISTQFGVTPVRIRQIHEKAFRKLRGIISKNNLKNNLLIGM